MKKIVSLALIAALLIASAVTAVSADDSEIPADTPITYGYLEIFKAELRQEIIDELIAAGVGQSAGYREVTVDRGGIIVLGDGCELIFRGGSACALTSADSAGNGIIDVSTGSELFSGEALSLGRIYLPASAVSRKAVVVTGEKAYFTLHGNYELL